MPREDGTTEMTCSVVSRSEEVALFNQGFGCDENPPQAMDIKAVEHKNNDRSRSLNFIPGWSS
jgi:hypothetical protein